MKTWIPMLTILFAVVGLCIWDGIYTKHVFNVLEKESATICDTLLYTDITNDELQNKILTLNDYWTDKMDILCISLSRKDMQPISDYLQYLCASIQNKNNEDAITYARLLNYNIIGLKECSGINIMNLL